MEAPGIKTIGYVFAILAIVALLGTAVVRLNKAAQEPPDTRTPEQRLNSLESSPSMKSPQAGNFIESERARRDETRAAEEAATGAMSR